VMGTEGPAEVGRSMIKGRGQEKRGGIGPEDGDRDCSRSKGPRGRRQMIKWKNKLGAQTCDLQRKTLKVEEKSVK